MHNILKNNCLIAAVVTLSLAMAGCSQKNEWTVDGVIDGAAGRTMWLEASSNGSWYKIDSISLPASGGFKFTRPAAGFPDIYRLRLDDKSLYFPVDSIETVTVMAKADAFDSDFTLKGSPQAEMMMDVERKLYEAVSRLGLNATGDSLLKREIGTRLLDDPAGIVSYYVINKRIGGTALFDPSNKRDLSIIGAVANAYSRERPNDPRTAWLSNLYVSNFASRRPSVPRDTVVAGEIGFFDIELYDSEGNKRSLKDEFEGGGPVILNFTVYSAESSPAYNAMLNSVYEKYRDRGLRIYQVSIDNDEFAWRQSAKNIPWTAVYNSAHDGEEYLLKYNVSAVPTTFVIGRDHEIKQRVEDITKLEDVVVKQL